MEYFTHKNGLKTAYNYIDKKSETLIIIFNGLNCTTKQYISRTTQSIADSLNVSSVAFDYWGIGESANAELGYKKESFFANEFLEQSLEFTKFIDDTKSYKQYIFIGYSMGGFYDMIIYDFFKNKVKALVGYNAGFSAKADGFAFQMLEQYGKPEMELAGKYFAYAVIEKDGIKMSMLENIPKNVPIYDIRAKDDDMVSYQTTGLLKEKGANIVEPYFGEKGSHKLIGDEYFGHFKKLLLKIK